MSLQITDLHKSFDGQVALERIHLAVGASEFVCLLGPSGCGKTTLLRIIAGLLPADGGSITLGGRGRAAGHGEAGRLWRALPRAAVGWPAAARGHCAGTGGEPFAAAARRAPVGAGCPRARRPAPRAARSAAPPWHSHHHGHARQGRSPGHGRPHRLHAGWAHCASGLTARAVPGTAHPLCGQLYGAQQPAAARPGPAAAALAGRCPRRHGTRIGPAVHPPGAAAATGQRTGCGPRHRHHLPGQHPAGAAALERPGPAGRIQQRQHLGGWPERGHLRERTGLRLGARMSTAAPSTQPPHLPPMHASERWLLRACLLLPLAALVLFFGVPMLAIAWRSPVQGTGVPGRRFVAGALALPMLAPSLVLGLGLIFLLGRNGIVGKMLGVRPEIYGFWGLLIADVLYALPQAVLIVRTALRQGDARQYDAAEVLGATPWRQ